MLEQKNVVKISSENKKVEVICDVDVSLGHLHDVLLEMKGAVVEKMYAAQKEEEAVSQKVKEIDKQIAEDEARDAVKEEEPK